VLQLSCHEIGDEASGLAALYQGFKTVATLIVLFISGMIRYEIRPFSWSKAYGEEELLKNKKRFFLWVTLASAWVFGAQPLLNLAIGFVLTLFTLTFLREIPSVKDRWIEKTAIKVVVGAVFLLLMIQGAVE
jgi:hypothetical protein